MTVSRHLIMNTRSAGRLLRTDAPHLSKRRCHARARRGLERMDYPLGGADDTVAGALQALGVRKGDRSDFGVELAPHLEVYFARRHGAVLHIPSTSALAPTSTYIVNHAGDKS